MLRELLAYADQHLSALPPGYRLLPVRYVLDLDAAGRLCDPQPLDTADPRQPATRHGLVRPVPAVDRSSAIRPALFADTAADTLGRGPAAAAPTRVAACHQAYRALLAQCAAATGDPAVQAVQAWLAQGGADQVQLPRAHPAHDRLTFRVADAWLSDRPAVQRWWADHRTSADRSAPVRRCQGCGQMRPLPTTLPHVTGLPGSTGGSALSAVNPPAFCSYGMVGAQHAACCHACGERSAAALTHLLRPGPHRLRLDDLVLVAWSPAGALPRTLFTPLTQPDPAIVTTLAAMARQGVPHPVDVTRLHALLLTHRTGRIVVRAWLDTTLPQLQQHVTRWLQDQQHPGGAPVSLCRLAAATVPAGTTPPPATRHALLRAALTGAPLPTHLLAQTLARGRATGTVSPAQAALLALSLRRLGMAAAEGPMAHHPPDPATTCGRLFAHLAAMSRAATGTEAPIMQAYRAASTRPATIFPRLLERGLVQLQRLRRDRPGLAAGFQERLEQIMADLDAFPTMLDLPAQGRFALGMVQQQAAARAAIQAARARRAGATPDAPDDAPPDDDGPDAPDPDDAPPDDPPADPDAADPFPAGGAQ